MQDIKEQEDIVSEFYFTGTLSMDGWIMDSSVDIFIAAKRDPFTCKIEISHSWGKPLLYFLIKEDKLEIIDFSEKKQYMGRFTPYNLSRFLPNVNCSPEMIWSFLRGYPYLPSSLSAYEGDPGIVSIEGENRIIIGTITFSPDKEIKEARSFASSFPDMIFSNFQKIEEIYYAEKSALEAINDNKDMTLKRSRIIFNRDIPDEIFTLKPQPTFEAISLD